MKILHLTLKKKPFEVMVTGEKTKEFRKDSGWIRSRLVTDKGIKKPYDAVKLTNGYGKDKPYFLTTYKGYRYANRNYTVEYSNGLKVEVEYGDFEIELGTIIEKGNIN
jgi:hypothetical protein